MEVEMPEGPEVQVMLDSMRTLAHREISLVDVIDGNPAPLKSDLSTLAGHSIADFRRHGKFMDFVLDDGRHFLVHLGMTGHFTFDAPKHMLFRLTFVDGASLYYSDPRNFSRVLILSEDELRDYPPIRDLGPDALDDSRERIVERLRELRDGGTRTAVKPFLLNYRNLSGIGNIYASEVLFDAGIDPRRPLKTLTDEEIALLGIAIHGILRKAYASGGSTIESFQDVLGENGTYQNQHRVYQRTHCVKCGGPILRIEQEQRSTFYCPVDQH
jgi:formamidopyrimidine-DNA glycosylase